MNEMIDEGKKVVKLEFDKTQWKEFGIEDKRQFLVEKPQPSMAPARNGAVSSVY